MPQRVTSPDFVGRGPELASLLDAVDRAGAGGPRAVFVAGESGVGKSRLLGELEREAAARGARVLAGECVMLAEGALPYAPIRSALRAAEAPEELLAQLVAAGSQQGLFELLLDLLTEWARAAPLVLIVEDVHWADRSTLDLLAFLLAGMRSEPLLLVCSYRTDELDRRHPLRAFLARHERPPAVQRVELRRFTREELAAQLQGILGAPADAALVARLHARTEGNPFFSEELLAASREGTTLPASLREALLLRIDALPAPAPELLRLAATHGRVVTHGLLAAAAGLSDSELDDALRRAVSGHVLVQRDAQTYAFRHALFAEALDLDLLAGERARLHVALAEAIASDPTLVDRDGRAAAELCAHWVGAGRDPEALAAAVEAGNEAEQVYAFAEAAGHLRRAIELWPRVADAATRIGMDQPALLARAAEAAHFAGDPDATALIEQAIESLDVATEPSRAAILYERLGRYLWISSGDDAGAQRAYEAAVALLPADEPRPELARVLATLSHLLMLRMRNTESLERCEQALAVARTTGARAEEGRALVALGSNLGALGDRAAAIVNLREGQQIAGEVGDLANVACGYVNLGEMFDQDGRFEEAIELAHTGARHSAQLGMGDFSRLLAGEAAARLFKLGRLAEAEDATRDALAIRPSLGALAQATARARIETQRADAAAAESFLQVAEEAMPYAPATWTEPLGSARVELALLRGDAERALTLAEHDLDGDYIAFTARRHALGARAAAMLADRARTAGDHDAAAAASERARAILARIDARLAPGAWRGSPPPEVLAYRAACAAELARAEGTAGAGEWAAVAERWTQLGLALEEAYARLRQGELHLAAGERGAAVTAVAEGRRIAHECGALWLEQQLDALARRGRLAPAGEDAGTTPFDLTERELAVLELVAQGLTNREIGEQLFMATKTASVHVSRILMKLGVSSRVEAATAAQRLGLVP